MLTLDDNPYGAVDRSTVLSLAVLTAKSAVYFGGGHRSPAG